MRERKWSQRDLAARIRAQGAGNVQHQHIQHLTKNPNLQPRYLMQLAAAAGMSVEQWAAWVPDPPADVGDASAPQPQPRTSRNSAGTASVGFVRFLRLDDVERADLAQDDEASEVVPWIDLTEEWCRALRLPRPYDRVRVMVCSGDAMRGEIEHGDLVFIDTQCTTVTGDGVYVLLHQTQPSIRRLALQVNGQVRVLATHPAIPAESVPLEQRSELVIVGRVVASLAPRRW